MVGLPLLNGFVPYSYYHHPWLIKSTGKLNCPIWVTSAVIIMYVLTPTYVGPTASLLYSVNSNTCLSCSVETPTHTEYPTTRYSQSDPIAGFYLYSSAKVIL